MRRPATLNPEGDQYSLWTDTYRWGTRQNGVVTLEALTGYTGYGAVLVQGELLPLDIEITPAPEGGTISVALDLAEVPQGSYPFDIWLQFENEAPFKWAQGQFIVHESVTPLEEVV